MAFGTFIFGRNREGLFPVVAGPAGSSLGHGSHGHGLVFLPGHVETGMAFLAGQSQILDMKIMAEGHRLGFLWLESNIPTADSSQGEAGK